MIFYKFVYFSLSSLQLSQDLNAVHLSQNQNHPLLTNPNPPHQHFSNSFSEPPASHSPNPNYQQYWQQPPPRLSQNPGAIYNNPPGPYPPNSSTDNYAAPPSYNAGFMDRTLPPIDKQNQSQKFQSHDMYPPPNQPPPPMSQVNKPPGYTNGAGFAPPTSQYPNSNMQARYPPSSHSPSVAQSNVQSNTGTAAQFNQASNAVPPQNRMGALPQPAVQNRRLDPDNMPSPVCYLMFIIFIKVFQ